VGLRGRSWRSPDRRPVHTGDAVERRGVGACGAAQQGGEKAGARGAARQGVEGPAREALLSKAEA
jgi:hypothetical protein